MAYLHSFYNTKANISISVVMVVDNFTDMDYSLC